MISIVNELIIILIHGYNDENGLKNKRFYWIDRKTFPINEEVYHIFSCNIRMIIIKLIIFYTLYSKNEIS